MKSIANRDLESVPPKGGDYLLSISLEDIIHVRYAIFRK